MSTTDFPVMLLTRGSDLISNAPSVNDVLSLMTKVAAERGMEGPPELALEYSSTEEYGKIKSRLLLLMAFHPAKLFRWVVHFLVSMAEGTSVILAMRLPHRDEFEVRTCCGVPSKYRVDCLLDDHAVFRTAVEWFLEHHTPCPSLSWVQYDDAVKDVDVSPG